MQRCIELRSGIMNAPTHQGMMTSPQVIPCPIDGASGPVDVEVFVTLIRFVDDMQLDEGNRMRKAMQDTLDRIQQRKAEEAGITLATSLPTGGKKLGQH